jgi:hypothetical protein
LLSFRQQTCLERAAGVMEAAKRFRRLRTYKQLPILRSALLPRQAKHAIGSNLELRNKAA